MEDTKCSDEQCRGIKMREQVDQTTATANAASTGIIEMPDSSVGFTLSVVEQAPIMRLYI